jgi:two-component system sensor histidine kinase YesM
VKIRRIQNTLIRAFSGLVVFTILLLGILSVYSLRRILVENAEQTTRQLVGELNRIIENYIKYMDDIALVAANNEDVQMFMEDPAADSPALRAAITRSFEAIRSVRKDIDAVFLFTRDGRAIAATAGFRPPPAVNLRDRYRELSNGLSPGRPSVSSAHVENLVDYRYAWVISLVRSMRAQRDGRNIGLIQVDLNYDVIAGLCRDIQLGTSGYVFIVSRNGEIVYHPRQQLIYGNLKSERIADILSLRGGYLRVAVDGRAILYTTVHPVWEELTVV